MHQIQRTTFHNMPRRFGKVAIVIMHNKSGQHSTGANHSFTQLDNHPACRTHRPRPQGKQHGFAGPGGIKHGDEFGGAIGRQIKLIRPRGLAAQTAALTQSRKSVSAPICAIARAA